MNVSETLAVISDHDRSINGGPESGLRLSHFPSLPHQIYVSDSDSVIGEAATPVHVEHEHVLYDDDDDVGNHTTLPFKTKVKILDSLSHRHATRHILVHYRT